jgi:hypothetical protein
MPTVTLSGKIEMLPLYKQQEVSDFVDFLLSSTSVADTKSALKRPYAGCMSGTFGEMSDDFNEPLDDFKDYM